MGSCSIRCCGRIFERDKYIARAIRAWSVPKAIRLTYAARRPTYATVPVARPACRVPPSVEYASYSGVSWPDGTVVSACGPIRPQGDGLAAAMGRLPPTGSPACLCPLWRGILAACPAQRRGGLARRPAHSAVQVRIHPHCDASTRRMPACAPLGGVSPMLVRQPSWSKKGGAVSRTPLLQIETILWTERGNDSPATWMTGVRCVSAVGLHHHNLPVRSADCGA